MTLEVLSILQPTLPLFSWLRILQERGRRRYNEFTMEAHFPTFPYPCYTQSYRHS